ncbi:hypothetical protein GCM10009850_102710 [Nonomuraea monospora]|uniref:MFS transporter n=1 Tax=Nonomuraea monospora TaxID=568818 RepID=A0ABP5PUW8_9ACTN
MRVPPARIIVNVGGRGLSEDRPCQFDHQENRHADTQLGSARRRTVTAVVIGHFIEVFGVSFLARSAGSLFFGVMADREGRRTAMMTSILLIGLATAGIGLIPTYATAALLSPVLLVLCRLLLGSPRVAFLIAAPPALVGLCFRFGLREPPAYEAARAGVRSASIGTALRRSRRMILRVSCVRRRCGSGTR